MDVRLCFLQPLLGEGGGRGVWVVCIRVGDGVLVYRGGGM